MIYTYKCSECSNEQEVWHKMAEENTEACSQCGAEPVKLKKCIDTHFVPHVSWSTWHVNGYSK